jgi:hypothetical protein
MADDKLQEKLVEYVEDAHAMEQNVLRMLDSMISTTDDPEIKEILSSTLAIRPSNRPHRLGLLQSPLRLVFACRPPTATRKKSTLINLGPCWQRRFERSGVKGAKRALSPWSAGASAQSGDLLCNG